MDDTHCVSVDNAMDSVLDPAVAWDDIFSSQPRYCFTYHDPEFKKLFGDVTHWIKEKECDVCEDAGKLLGAVATGFEDAAGVGEAEAGVLATIKAAVTVVKKENKDAKMCAKFAKPIADLVHWVDPRVNEDNLGGCLTEICTTMWEAVVDSLGQALLSEVLSNVAALMCHCKVPFESCMKLI